MGEGGVAWRGVGISRSSGLRGGGILAWGEVEVEEDAAQARKKGGGLSVFCSLT